MLRAPKDFVISGTRQSASKNNESFPVDRARLLACHLAERLGNQSREPRSQCRTVHRIVVEERLRLEVRLQVLAGEPALRFPEVRGASGLHRSLVLEEPPAEIFEVASAARLLDPAPLSSLRLVEGIPRPEGA